MRWPRRDLHAFLATRGSNRATSAVLREVIELYTQAGFDLVLVETAGNRPERYRESSIWLTCLSMS